MSQFNCSPAADGGAWVDYVAGRVDASQAAAMAAHAVGCPACQREMAEQAAVWAALEEYSPAAVSADFDARLYARIARSEAQGEGWMSRLVRSMTASWRPAMAVSGVCAVLLMAVMLRTPETNPASVTAMPAVEKAQSEPVDLETLESALEDLEMLKVVDAGAGRI